MRYDGNIDNSSNLETITQYIESEDVKHLILELRNKLCSSVKPGTFEAWIGATTEGTLEIVSGKLETGIKIIIECK